jgi:HEAT repeat protein
VPDLLAAIDRFFVEDSDPQCWAKNAIVEALAQLGHDDSDVYARAARHVQMEPVWGKRVDTAGPLRARSALALAQCRNLPPSEILGLLLERLADPEASVRSEAARAVARMGSDCAALLLRLRAAVGDDEPEVVGTCLSGALAIQGGSAVDFVSGFLERGGDVAGEAALALGGMPDGAGFEPLREFFDKQPGRPAPVLFTALALTRRPEALDLLLSQVRNGSADAVAAIAAVSWNDDAGTRTADAVAASGDARMRAAFQKHFPR